MFYGDPLYTVACAPIEVVIAATSAYCVARLLRELGYGRTIALWGLALYGLASPAIVYAKADWAQPLCGLCWIAALWSSIRFTYEGRRRDLGIAAIAVGYGVITRSIEGTFILPAVLAVLVPHFRPASWSAASRRAVGAVISAFVLGMSVNMAVNFGRYGSPLNFGYAGEGWSAPLGITLPAVLISPGWGIIWEFPAILLAPLGAVSLRQRERGRIAFVMTVLTVAQLLNTAAWHDWTGGWNWGLRLFLPALPITAVLAAAGVASLPNQLRVWVPTLLFAGGIVWAAPCVLTNLLGGYAGMVTDGQIYVLRNYPPVGAWQFVHQWSDIDVLWTRIGSASGATSLLIGAILLLGSVTLALRARRFPE